jgi:ribulose 1,5-bisphosphate carboxylase large subunit-like protein
MEAIAEYLRQYESIVRQLIREHESKKAELQNYIGKITNIIRELAQRRNQLVKEQGMLRRVAGDNFRHW